MALILREVVHLFLSSLQSASFLRTTSSMSTSLVWGGVALQKQHTWQLWNTCGLQKLWLSLCLNPTWSICSLQHHKIILSARSGITGTAWPGSGLTYLDEPSRYLGRHTSLTLKSLHQHTKGLLLGLLLFDLSYIPGFSQNGNISSYSFYSFPFSSIFPLSVLIRSWLMCNMIFILIC